MHTLLILVNSLGLVIVLIIMSSFLGTVLREIVLGYKRVLRWRRIAREARVGGRRRMDQLS